MTAGAIQAGADVIDLGLVSTDLLYHASATLDAPGAMITASHNPAGYNGIKLCFAGAAPSASRLDCTPSAAGSKETTSQPWS